MNQNVLEIFTGGRVVSSAICHFSVLVAIFFMKNVFFKRIFFFTKFAFPQIEKFIQRINNKVTMSSWINQYARISFYQYTPWPFIINAIAMHKYKTVKYNKNTYSYRTCASRINRIQQFIYCVWFWIRADLFWLEVISVCPKTYHQLLSKRSA